MNDQDRSSNLPTILVVLLALFGLATIPRAPGGRGGGSSGNGPPAAEEVASGHPSTDEADEDSPKLGPLLPLREYWRGADNRGRDLRSRDELLERSERLRFLIVTVPDPDDTSVSHAFDSTLGAVLRAVDAQEYLGSTVTSLGTPKRT